MIKQHLFGTVLVLVTASLLMLMTYLPDAGGLTEICTCR